MTTRGLSSASVPAGKTYKIKRRDKIIIDTKKLKQIHLYTAKRGFVYKNSRGTEGVKTVKMLPGRVMSSRLDVMQLLFFFFLRKTQADHKEEKCEERDKFCYVVCLHVCIGFPFGPFFASHKHRCQGFFFYSNADHYTPNTLQAATGSCRLLT